MSQEANVQSRESALEDREANVQSRESALEDRETNAVAIEKEANVRVQALRQEEEAIKSELQNSLYRSEQQSKAGIDEISRLVSDQGGKVEEELRETTTALGKLSTTVAQLSTSNAAVSSTVSSIDGKLVQIPTQVLAATFAKFTEIENAVVGSSTTVQESLSSKFKAVENVLRDQSTAVQRSVTSLEQMSTTAFESISEKLSQTLAGLQSVSSTVNQYKESLDQQTDDFNLTVKRSFDDSAKVLMGNLNDLDKKLDESSNDLAAISTQIMSIAPSIIDIHSDDHDTVVEHFTTVTTTLEALKKDVAEVRQCQTVRQEKRSSDVSLPDLEARKRRASGRQDATISPGSQQSQPSSRPGSPLLTRSITRVGKQSQLPGPTHPADTSVPDVQANTTASPANEMLPEGSEAPQGESAAVWRQILLKGEWTEVHCRQLLAFLEETSRKKDARYRPQAGLDHSARVEKEDCLLSYCKRQPNKVSDPKFKCQQYAKRDLCLRVKYITEDPGDFDEASESMRWSLEIRPPQPA